MGKRAQSRAEWRRNNVYNNKFEEKIAQQMEASNIPFDYEAETIVYVQPAQTRKYTPDFFLPNGIIIETKGKWTVEDRKKMVLVMEQNPALDIRMLFQYNNKLNKNAKQTYAQWCDRRGIKYAVGVIPEDWIDEIKRDPSTQAGADDRDESDIGTEDTAIST